MIGKNRNVNEIWRRSSTQCTSPLPCFHLCFLGILCTNYQLFTALYIRSVTYNLFHVIRRSPLSISRNFCVSLLGHILSVFIFQTPQCFIHGSQQKISRMRSICTMVFVSRAFSLVFGGIISGEERDWNCRAVTCGVEWAVRDG